MHVFFSGTEEEEVSSMLDTVGVKDQLVSYLYLVKRGISLTSWLKEKKEKGIRLFLDSGAHTLLSEETKRDISYYDDYMNRYLKFLKKYGEYFFCFVELDIDRLIGIKHVEEWREQIISELGREPIVVWHEERGIKTWKEQCKKYSYNGLASRDVYWRYPYESAMMNIARQYKTKVHGFAMTAYKSMTRLPYYSVDSTSWLSGIMWGQTFYRKGLIPGKPKLVTSNKRKRKQYRYFCEKNGIDFNKLVKDEGNEINKFNAIMWRDYIESINFYKKKIGIEYWNE